MKFEKPTNKSNFSSLDKVQIIKNVFLTHVPFSSNIYLSEMQFSAGKEFDEIEITDGSYSITDDDEGNGTIYNCQVNFRHPKVRPDAEDYLKTYRGKTVRLIITDKNGINRLTPPGKLTITENIPDMPNYNGYSIGLSTQGDMVPFITLDNYPVPPVSLWDQVYESLATMVSLVNLPFSLQLNFFNWTDTARLLMLDFNGNLEIISFNAYERKELTRIYPATEGSYIKIKGVISDGDVGYNNYPFPTQSTDELLLMQNAGATRFAASSNPYNLNLSGNAIIKSDINALLEQYNLMLTQPQYWDETKYFFIDGGGQFGSNAVPDSVLALQIKAAMIAAGGAVTYADNS